MKKAIMIFLFYLMRIFPIKQNKIVFVQFLGKGYGDNCKYIAEELLKRPEKYDIVWLVRPNAGDFPKGIRTVKYLSLRAVYEQVTAKVWVDNCRKPGYVRKRKNQYYIQTWHGGLAFKRIEKDAENSLPHFYIEAAKRDSKIADLFLSNSIWNTELYRCAFWFNGKIEDCGLPREDILFRNSITEKNRIKQKLGITENTKILLYAPTFRKNMDAKSLKLYYIPWKKILNALSDKLGGTWIGMIRLHPDLSIVKQQLNVPNDIIDETDYPDMQELLLVADSIITDYSSCILDYSITKKPGFLYAPDYEEYMNDRNFYFDMEKLPFGLAFNTDELIAQIKNFDNPNYLQQLAVFQEKCGIFQGGMASGHVAEIINQMTK